MPETESFEVTQDADGGVCVTPVSGDGGCHSGDTMEAAARKAGKSEILDQYAADYPTGPHDKPQEFLAATTDNTPRRLADNRNGERFYRPCPIV